MVSDDGESDEVRAGDVMANDDDGDDDGDGGRPTLVMVVMVRAMRGER